MKKLFAILVCIAILAACVPATEIPVTPTSPPTPLPTSTPTATSTPVPDALWVSPAVPDVLREIAKSSGIPLVSSIDFSTKQLDVSDSGSVWIYALVAPFPTVTDDVPFEDLMSVWKGASNGLLAGRSLLMAEST